jgi:hypothetical protein
VTERRVLSGLQKLGAVTSEARDRDCRLDRGLLAADGCVTWW